MPVSKKNAQLREEIQIRADIRKAKNEQKEAVNPFNEFVEAYYYDPVGFAKDMLHVELYDYQKGPLEAMARGDRKIAVRSGHGTGKSTDAAIAALWFMLTRFPCRVVMTAPTIAQLNSVLFASIRTYILELPIPLQQLLEVQSDRVFLKAAPDDAWMAARTARAESPEALAGIHAENVLLIGDEASGIPDNVFEHAIGSMSGQHAHTLLLSNPTRRNGYFYNIFNNAKAKIGWSLYHFSCLDSPLVTDEFVEEVINTYGLDSNAYKIRVLGDFPTEDVDALIPGELVLSAMKRDIEDPDGVCVLGLDVARMGGDRSALCVRRGNRVEDMIVWEKVDLMETVGKTVAYIQDMPNHMRPAEICVDAIGMGAGVADRLTEVCDQRNWNIHVISVNVAEASTFDDRAHRLKDELLLKFRDWLEEKVCSLPNREDLYDDIVAPGYKFSSAGKIQVESKPDMRRRGVKSTDMLDSIALTFAGNAFRVISGNRQSWNRPLKRGLKGIV